MSELNEEELKEFARKRLNKDIIQPQIEIKDDNINTTIQNDDNISFKEVVNVEDTTNNNEIKEEIIVETDNITKDISENNIIISNKPTDVIPVNEEIIIENKEISNDIDNGYENTEILPEIDDIEIEDSEEKVITSEEKEVEIVTEEEIEEDTTQNRSNAVKIGSTGERKSIKRVSSFNPTDNVRIVDSDDYQAAVVSQYIMGNTDNAFVGPKSVTRVILPYSGIFYDLSSYTNSDMLGIHRSTNDITFVEKIEKELYSAYEHTVNNSFKKKLDFAEWLRNIKYPDLWCIYWGIYTVNHPGINSYRSKCDYCPEEIEEKRDNYSISFVSDQSIDDIDQETIDKIRNGVDRDMINSYKISSRLIKKENFLPEKKFKVFHGMPNMEEVMTFLKYLKVDLNEDDEIIRYVLYPISWLELERNFISKATISKILSYKYMMYTKKLYVPVFEEMKSDKEENKTKIKATYVDVKFIMIYPLLNALSKEDFKEFASGKELKKLLIKEGIHFRVKDSICPKCEKKQKITALDMRDILFTRAEALTDFLITM